MSILLDHQDYAAENGAIVSVSGGEELLNEALFRLTARRGSFPLMPEFGSKLYKLHSEKPSQRQALAREYAAQALSDLPDITVTDAVVTEGPAGLFIRIMLDWKGTGLTVDLEG